MNKIIAFYLPQYHPIPENDIWWGKGFTEWTSVGKAKPLFNGHYQPRVPADLGYYDLRLPEIREQQAQMAREAGIYGFCYWHYWFGDGKQLLEKPFKEVVDSGKPDFPFCLGWANESWKAKTWNSDAVKKDKILIEQKYLGEEDNEKHFYSLLNAFNDDRYIKYEGKPIFLIYKPEKFQQIKLFIKQWNTLAKLNGFNDGFQFIAHTASFKNYNILKSQGFNSITINPISRAMNATTKHKLLDLVDSKIKRIIGIRKLKVIEYKRALKFFINKNEDSRSDVIPTIIPNWDHSPRSGKFAWILHNSSPKLFAKHVEQALECLKDKPQSDKIIFLKSWNEWGEGNYMEPDLIFGKEYLNALKDKLEKFK